MKYNKVSRRHFLQGTGGSLLALPFLPSLMSKAEAATLANPRFLVAYWNSHGGVNLQNNNPITSNPAVKNQLTTTTLYPAKGHSMVSGNLTSLKTTRASNLPYLSTYLGNDLPDADNLLPAADGYGLNMSGADLDNGAARVSPIIGSFVSDALLQKMTLIAGLDFMFGTGHNCIATGNFCNFFANTQSSPSTAMKNVWTPSIDAVAAAYPGFYGTSNPLAPSILLNNNYYSGNDFLNGYISSYRSSTGIVANSNSPSNIGDCFNFLFGSLLNAGSGTQKNKKDFILNKVHDDYVRVARGAYGPGRRIGKDDRNRFEEFISNIVSIITGVTSYGVCTIPSGISATDKTIILNASGTPAAMQNVLSIYNQMIVAAFSCGLTQQFILGIPNIVEGFNAGGSANPTFTTLETGPDPHHAAFHHHNDPPRQQYIVENQRMWFQYGFYDLMQKLDAITIPSGAGTLLDQSFMYWTAEAGYNTHSGFNMPMYCAGGGGGFIKTGKFVDYRAANRQMRETSYNSLQGYQGIPFNRFLGTALQALGIPPSAYEQGATLFAGSTGRIPISSLGTVPGYGHTFQQMLKVNGGAGEYLYDYQLNDMSVPLPGIT